MKILLFLLTFHAQNLPDSVRTWQVGRVMVSDWFRCGKDFCYFRVDLPHQKIVEIRLKSDSKISSLVHLRTRAGIVQLNRQKEGKYGFVSFYLHEYNKSEWDKVSSGMISIDFTTINGKSHTVYLSGYNLEELKRYAN